MWHVAGFLFGVVLYSLMEYAIHRWLLHGPLKAHHRVHHQYPTKLITVPWWVAGLILLTVWGLTCGSIAVGVLVGWLLSGSLHWRLHVGNLTATWALSLRRHHEAHHKKAATNFGVTNRFWDKVFGTLQ